MKEFLQNCTRNVLFILFSFMLMVFGCRRIKKGEILLMKIIASFMFISLLRLYCNRRKQTKVHPRLLALFLFRRETFRHSLLNSQTSWHLVVGNAKAGRVESIKIHDKDSVLTFSAWGMFLFAVKDVKTRNT